MDSLPPAAIAFQKAHIGDNLSSALIGLSTTFTALALTSLFGRLLARRLAHTSLWFDDYVAIAAAVRLPSRIEIALPMTD